MHAARLVLVIASCALGLTGQGLPADAARATGIGLPTGPSYLSPWRPLFVENHGQWAEAVSYRTPLGPSRATVSGNALVLTQVAQPASGTGDVLVGHNVLLRFLPGATDASPSPAWEGAEASPTRMSWFHGKDPDKWITDVPTWVAARLPGVAPGITVEVHGRNGNVEYDVLIEPGAVLEDLVIQIEGAEHFVLADDGSLALATPLGVVRQLAPVAWEEVSGGARRPLAASVKLLTSDRFGFTVIGREPGHRLVIDPQLVYSTFVEGSGTEEIMAVAVDGAGSAYGAGSSSSIDFPTTPGAFDESIAPAWMDAFVTKLVPDGSDLVYATFLGGAPATSYPAGIQVNALGEALVAGSTSSTAFPTTPGAYQVVSAGGSEGYVLKLNAMGTALAFSSLFGGSLNDGVADLALDPFDRPVIGVATKSFDLPTSQGAFQPRNPNTGLNTVTSFVARLSADGSMLDYGSYFGGTNFDEVRGVAADAAGAFYISGRTDGTAPCPTTPGAFQTVPSGFADAFVAKFQPDGQLAWSTLLGGNDDDWVFALEVDDTGHALAAGYTRSFNFPTTPQAFDKFKNGDKDGFLTKLLPDGSGLAFSSFLGSTSSWDEITDTCFDAAGACLVTGRTGSPATFPVTPDAVTAGLASGDVFVGKVSESGDQLLFAGLLGDPNPDKSEYAYGIAADAAGAAYVTGYTLGKHFPTTPGAFDTTLSGSNGAYVVKLDFSPWADSGGALAGTSGIEPQLAGSGTLQPGAPGALVLTDARPLSPLWLIIGTAELSAPFKGGVMVPAPLAVLPLATDASGEMSLSWSAWPTGLPAGLEILFQAWVIDPAGPKGWAASNGLQAILPVVALTGG